MKVLIINSTIQENCNGRSLGGLDCAITFELYRKYFSGFGICANNIYDKYIYIDERDQYIGTFSSMDKLLARKIFLGNCLVLTHEQWLDKQNPEWRTEKRYQYW